MILSKQQGFALLLSVMVLGSASAAETEQGRKLRGGDTKKVRARRLPSKPTGSKSPTSKSPTKSPTSVISLISQATTTTTNSGRASGSKGMSDKSKMKSNKSGTVNAATFALSGGMAKSKGMGKSKNKGKSKNNMSVNAGTQAIGINNNLVGRVDPATEPPKLRPDLEDWMDGCQMENQAIDNCIVVQSSISNSANCKLCLKGLASFNNPPPPSDNGVRLCAENPTCGQCTADNIRPFYACGLRVDAAFNSTSTESTTTTPGTGTADAVVMTTPPVATTPPTAPVRVDTENCPSLWPGLGIPCVMLRDFDKKYCVYPEYSLDSICECTVQNPVWSCRGGPESFEIALGPNTPPGVGNLVTSPAVDSTASNDNTAITTPAVTTPAMGGATTPATGAGSMPKPMPVSTIDAVINTLP